jgi:hypothetical protein
MVVLAAVLLAATPPQPRPVGAAVQATATIRVIRAVHLKFGGARSGDAPAPRSSSVKGADGSVQTASLIEFE